MTLSPTGGISQGLGKGEALSSAPHPTSLSRSYSENHQMVPCGLRRPGPAERPWLSEIVSSTSLPWTLTIPTAFPTLGRLLSYFQGTWAIVAEEAHRSLIRTFSLLKGLWWKSPREKEWNLGMKFRVVDPVRWCLKPSWVLFFKCAWRVSYITSVNLHQSWEVSTLLSLLYKRGDWGTGPPWSSLYFSNEHYLPGHCN